MRIFKQVDEEREVDHTAAIDEQVQLGILNGDFLDLNSPLIGSYLLDPDFGKFGVNQGVTILVFQVQVTNLNAFEKRIGDRGKTYFGLQFLRDFSCKVFGHHGLDLPVLQKKQGHGWDGQQNQHHNQPYFSYLFDIFVLSNCVPVTKIVKVAMAVTILGIESSCDDTSAAVIRDRTLLSNVIADQEVHKQYGGVVPELASRAHQQNIVPVVHRAIGEAGIRRSEIDAVAFTRGPGLLGSLLVGTSFTKGFSAALGVPMIEVNHLQAHILVHFIENEGSGMNPPGFPFICLLVSGGHTQLVLVRDHHRMEIIGRTIDDASGEAFDKCAKLLGLPYPGGPHIDRLAKRGNPHKFAFSKPRLEGFDYSFSGLKTSFLYFLRDQLRTDSGFIEKNLPDLAASLQHTIVEILMDKLIRAAGDLKIKQIALAGGVSANSGLRDALRNAAVSQGWNTYIPPIRYTTDNAAMIAITGYFRYLKGAFASEDVAPQARIYF
jgi:N6-L-threonylcarbamoyladenine synthase